VATDVQAILRERDRELRDIDGKVEWTQEAKEGRKRAVRELYQRVYEEAKQEEKQQLEKRLAETKNAVFRVPRGYGSSDAEYAQIQLAFHSFWRQVVAATEDLGEEGVGVLPGQWERLAEEKLGTILEQAERTDNEQLMSRAIYHRAIDLGAQSIVDRYLATSPVDAKNWRLYTEAAQEMQQAKSPENLLGQALTGRMFDS